MSETQNNLPADSGGNSHRFSEILLDLATRLIQSTPQDIAVEIDQTLKTVCKHFKLDNLSVHSFSGTPDHLATIFASSTSEHTLLPSTISEEELPWIMQKINEEQPLLLTEFADELPSSAKRGEQLPKKLGIRSIYLLPISTTTTDWGFLCASCLGRRLQDLQLGTQLGDLRNLIATVIERKHGFDHISSLLQFDQLLSEISAKYINLPVEDIEKSIRLDLGRLGTQMDADRCLLYLFDEDKKIYSTCSNKYLWSPQEDTVATAAGENFIAEHKDFDAKYLQYAFDQWHKGKTLLFSSPEDLPAEAHRFKLASIEFGNKSHLSVPMSFNRVAVGALVICSNRYNQTWHPDVIRRVRLYGDVFANALMRKQNGEKLNRAFVEIKELKERIESDYIYLKNETEHDLSLSGFIGKSAAIKSLLDQIKKVAATDTTVLLLGETGTGKGVTARAIHKASSRRNRPLIQVNCAALSPSVIESELFGHEKGAYTDAVSKRLGRFEIADGTTLFLDEIGELSYELQAKLLRVLENGEFERVGGSATLKTDVRIIAATNKNLVQEAAAGKFRLDLWYRLSVFPLYLLPLRERTDDIQLFVEWFIDKYGTQKGRNFTTVSKNNIALLQGYDWPGNIRELENLVERAVITSEGPSLNIVTPNLSAEKTFETSYRFSEFEREHIYKVLQACGWKIEGRGGTAEALDMNPGTLRSRMKKLGISRAS